MRWFLSSMDFREIWKLNVKEGSLYKRDRQNASMKYGIEKILSLKNKKTMDQKKTKVRL